MQIFEMIRTQTAIPKGPRFTYQIRHNGRVVHTSGHSNEYVAAIVYRTNVGRGVMYSAHNWTGDFASIGRGVNKKDETIVGVAILGRPNLTALPRWIYVDVMKHFENERPPIENARIFYDNGGDGVDFVGTVENIRADDESQCMRGECPVPADWDRSPFDTVNGRHFVKVWQCPGMAPDRWDVDHSDQIARAEQSAANAESVVGLAWAVAAAWNDAGRAPAVHARAKNKLRAEWRTLANAVEALAKTFADRATPGTAVRVMLCAICGKQADGTAAYCKYCGGRLQFATRTGSN